MRTLMTTFVVSLAGLASSVWAGPPQHAPATSPALDVRRVMSALPVSQTDQPDEAPPLTVRAALDEALARNPRLTVLRREYETLQHRPAQALALSPPSFEAQIWQWPLNPLSPRNTTCSPSVRRSLDEASGRSELRSPTKTPSWPARRSPSRPTAWSTEPGRTVHLLDVVHTARETKLATYRDD